MKKTIKEIFEFMNKNKTEVRELLEQKGFSTDVSVFTERVALLHTEIAELTDAYKKGLPAKEEAMELADIVIRLLSFPVIIPEISDLAEDIQHEFVDISDIPSNRLDDTSLRYRIFVDMQLATSQIGVSITEMVNMVYNGYESNSVEMSSSISTLIFSISFLYMMCENYAQIILHENLQDLFDVKMDKNWNRPYRYNTNPDLFDK